MVLKMEGISRASCLTVMVAKDNVCHITFSLKSWLVICQQLQFNSSKMRKIRSNMLVTASTIAKSLKGPLLTWQHSWQERAWSHQPLQNRSFLHLFQHLREYLHLLLFCPLSCTSFPHLYYIRHKTCGLPYKSSCLTFAFQITAYIYVENEFAKLLLLMAPSMWAPSFCLDWFGYVLFHLQLHWI